jgi:hypothetical protein
MENTQGTHAVQVNNRPNSQSSGFAPAPEGSDFAAVNPPVDPSRCGIVPRLGPAVAIVEHSGEPGSESRVREMMAAYQRPGRLDGRTICGVVTIKNSEWRPKKVGDIPSSLTQGLGMELSAQFAMVYNQSQFARSYGRWAVVTNRGTVLILTGIRGADRPINPADFPPCVQGGMTYENSEALISEANEPRFKLAAVPREWAIAIRRADSMEGGAA